MNYQIPQDLVKNIKERKASFFIGAGMSIPAGFPSWECLIENLIEKYKELPHYLVQKVEDYEKIKNDSTKYLLLAEDLREQLGPKKYYDNLEEIFGIPDAKPTDNHKILVDLKPSFILTLNYDRLIENAFNQKDGYFPKVFSYRQNREAANSFWKEDFFIFKAHGDAFNEPSNIILTQTDYRKVLFRENGYRSLLQTMFTSKSMLLLGLSMNDPEFQLLLEYLHDSYHNGGPLHYMLAPENESCNTLMKRYLDDFNIQTIPFNNDDGDYKEITNFLKDLYAEVQK